MPATNYGWSLQDSSTIFQALGTKRKFKDSEEPISKRQCTNFICDNVYNEMKVAATNMHCDGDRDRTGLVPMKTSSQTYMTENRVPELHSQYSPQPALTHQECKSSNVISSCSNVTSQGAFSSVVEENNNNVPSLNCPEGAMIMDIQDECFTKVMLPCDVTTDAEYEAACSMVAAMESDGAPDPSQYISYCSSPRRSNGNSSNVSLSPGWSSFDNATDMMDIKPYVSDYY